jgi:hypothetical protein
MPGTLSGFEVVLAIRAIINNAKHDGSFRTRDAREFSKKRAREFPRNVSALRAQPLEQLRRIFSVYQFDQQLRWPRNVAAGFVATAAGLGYTQLRPEIALIDSELSTQTNNCCFVFLSKSHRMLSSCAIDAALPGNVPHGEILHGKSRV